MMGDVDCEARDPNELNSHIKVGSAFACQIHYVHPTYFYTIGRLFQRRPSCHNTRMHTAPTPIY